MIKEIFGKPVLPNVINDCSLRFNEDEIYIGKVYVFDANYFSELIRFGDLPIYRIFKEKRIVGYFSTSYTQMCKNNDGIYKIIGTNANASNCQIDGVSFTKIHHSMSKFHHRIHIKFVAKNIKNNYI
jgi:hypothetical protein